MASATRFSIVRLLEEEEGTAAEGRNDGPAENSSESESSQSADFSGKFRENSSNPSKNGQQQQETPTLAELQVFFGLNVRKHEYSRARRRAVERKPRQTYSAHQLNTLEQSFMSDKYLSVQKRVQLATDLALSETQVKTWFQNRRTKWKKQLTDSLRQLCQQQQNAKNLFGFVSSASGESGNNV